MPGWSQVIHVAASLAKVKNMKSIVASLGEPEEEVGLQDESRGLHSHTASEADAEEHGDVAIHIAEDRAAGDRPPPMDGLAAVARSEPLGPPSPVETGV